LKKYENNGVKEEKSIMKTIEKKLKPENLSDITTIKSGIYKIENKINGKYYIGSAYDFNRRFIRHKSELNCNKHYNEHLQRAWNMYGEKSFEFSILEICDDKSKLKLIEQNYLDSIDKDKCYNKTYIAGGGNLGDDVNKKISLKMKTRVFTEEHKRKISKTKSIQQVGKKNPKFDSTIYTWENLESNITETCTRWELYTKYNLDSNHIHKLVKGKIRSHKGWTLQPFTD